MGLSEHTVAYVHLGCHSFVLSEEVGRKGDITEVLPPVARGAGSIFSVCCVSRHRRDACLCGPKNPAACQLCRRSQRYTSYLGKAFLSNWGHFKNSLSPFRFLFGYEEAQLWACFVIQNLSNVTWQYMSWRDVNFCSEGGEWRHRNKWNISKIKYVKCIK